MGEILSFILHVISFLIDFTFNGSLFNMGFDPFNSLDYGQLKVKAVELSVAVNNLPIIEPADIRHEFFLNLSLYSAGGAVMFCGSVDLLNHVSLDSLIYFYEAFLNNVNVALQALLDEKAQIVDEIRRAIDIELKFSRDDDVKALEAKRLQLSLQIEHYEHLRQECNDWLSHHKALKIRLDSSQITYSSLAVGAVIGAAYYIFCVLK